MFADVMFPRSLVAPSVFAILGNKKGPATNGGALSLGSIRSGRNEWVSLSTPDDLRLVIFCHSFVFSGRAVARTSDQRQAGAFAQNESAPMPQPCHVLHQIGCGNRRQDDQKARRTPSYSIHARNSPRTASTIMRSKPTSSWTKLPVSGGSLDLHLALGVEPRL